VAVQADLDRRADRETERASVAQSAVASERRTRAAARRRRNGMRRVRVSGAPGRPHGGRLYMAWGAGRWGVGVGRGPLPPRGLPGLMRRGGDRAGLFAVPCPGRATGWGDGPGTAWCLGPGRHGHDNTGPGRASGRAVPRAGPKTRAAGRASGPRAAWPSML